MDRQQVLIARAVFPEALAHLCGHFEVEPNPDDSEWTAHELSRRLRGKAGLLATSGERIVFENEPALNPALLELPNVVLLPHIGSATEATRRAMVGCAVDNRVAALTGGAPPTPINPEVLRGERWRT